jgi:hypothetical protein
MTDRLTEADLLRLQLAEERIRSASLVLELAKAQHATVGADVRIRYGIRESDVVKATGEIERADTPDASGP